jgi:hypothetical protein
MLLRVVLRGIVAIFPVFRGIFCILTTIPKVDLLFNNVWKTWCGREERGGEGRLSVKDFTNPLSVEKID